MRRYRLELEERGASPSPIMRTAEPRPETNRLIGRLEALKDLEALVFGRLVPVVWDTRR
jgi:hypothetical protein